ncbi:Myo-inositol-1-phosphate synthase [Pseudomonas syringae pv. actinidiae]|uniref:Myo-inositol-1-phosphate synthase n=1 Tax=Pseudomonas syringae pv. actinidiae TaxID=103796 RepID=A0AAN4Q7D2_PSESF|nr:Myo-inositol-1-phosphate synthase [Pseudomonas syringae pv. actinidiae]
MTARRFIQGNPAAAACQFWQRKPVQRGCLTLGVDQQRVTGGQRFVGRPGGQQPRLGLRRFA